MPDDTSSTETPNPNLSRDDEAFYSAFADRFAEVDEQHVRETDGFVDGEEEEEGTSGTTAERTAEHPAAETSEKPDGAASESVEDSAVDDDDEHPDGADDDDAPDDSDDDDEREGGATEGGDTDEGEAVDDAVSDVAKAAAKLLEAKGADLKIEDLPEAARPIVTKKLQGINAAFTRVMQEQTEFRARAAALEAEERFREENTDLYVMELLRKDPELIDRINTLQRDLVEDDTFETDITQRRKAATDAVTQEQKAAQEEYDRWVGRAEVVESTGRKLAAAAGLPWHFADRALTAALEAKPQGQRDLSENEIAVIVANEAKHLDVPRREKKRAESKATIQSRTAARRTAAVTPSPARPATVVSPRPAVAPSKEKVDWNDEESRHRRMLQTARRVAPGVRDK